MTLSKHIKNPEHLKDVVQQHREAGQTIALTNGCYDLLHVGHLRSIEGAKQTADILIVALNSDASVHRWKGPALPVVPEAERMEMIAGFACVDHVYVFDDPSVDSLLELIKPDSYCKGPEYTMENLPEAETVRRLGIRFETVGDPKDHASSSMIDRVVAAYDRRSTMPAKGSSPPDKADLTMDTSGRRVEIISERRVFEGFLSLDEVRLSHETPDGSMSPEMIRQNVERGDGAGVLLINKDSNCVVLTRQFRYAAWKRNGDGWTLEVPAGTVAEHENPEDIARAEAAEEVGYRVGAMRYLTTFFASPGTTSERVILYEAHVTNADRLDQGGGGLAEEHEYIEIVEMPIEEALGFLDAGGFTDAKTVIAMQSLKQQRDS